MTVIREMPTSGLDLFATAWTQRWVEKGGVTHIDHEGKAWFWMPEYYAWSGRIEPDADLPEEIKREQDRFRSVSHGAAMRELLDLAEAVPGGTAAIKALAATRQGLAS
jgi:hypothetical protein